MSQCKATCAGRRCVLGDAHNSDGKYGSPHAQGDILWVGSDDEDCGAQQVVKRSARAVKRLPYDVYRGEL
jgi:hypothetical protein